MSHRYFDNPDLFGVMLMLILLISIASGIVLGASIANAPFIGAHVGWAIGSLIVGKLIFDKAKATAGPTHPSATQPEE